MTDSATLLQLLVDLALSAVVIVAVVVAGALLLRRYWRHAPYLAPVYGMLVCGVVGFATFGAWFLGAVGGSGGREGIVGHAGRGFCWLVALATVAVLGVAAVRARRERQFAGTSTRPSDVLVVALLVLAIAGITVGLLMLWTSSDPLFVMVRNRFVFRLPIDNELPSAYAGKLYAHLDPREAVAGWQSSDRPQLQTGLLLLVDGIVHRGPAASSTLHFATGLLAQLSWIPGCYALARSVGLRRFPAALGIVFAGATGTVLVNTVYTWPKLISAGMLLGGLAVIIEAGRRRDRSVAPMVALGVAIALSFLCHGAALFALPVVLCALVGARRWWRPRVLAAGVAAAAVLYVPWLAYQRYFDPPGDRLLKWHLAGVTAPTRTSLLESLRAAYGGMSWSDILASKWHNLLYPFSQLPWAGLSWHGVDLRARTAVEFRYLDTALGCGLVLIVVLLVHFLVTEIRGRLRREGSGGWAPEATEERPAAERRIVALILGCALAVVVWSLLMYLPESTSVHQGTHVVVLIPLALPAALLATRAPRAAVLVLAVQAALFLKTYGPDLLGASHWHRLPAALLLVGVAVAGAVLAWLARIERSPGIRLAVVGQPQATPCEDVPIGIADDAAVPSLPPDPDGRLLGVS